MVFLMRPDGSWELSPAYDLTWSKPQMGRRATSVLGDFGFAISKAKLMELADNHDIKNAKMIIKEVTDSIAQWENHAAIAGLSSAAIELFRTRFKQLQSA